MYKTIIIDDEPLALEDLKASINFGPDFTLIGEFTRSTEALDFLLDKGTANPDVVFTDIKMPKITGLRLMEILREAGLACLVVVISGYDEFSYAQQALRQGAVDYCLKPVNPEAMDLLMERLRRQLAAKAPALPSMPLQSDAVFDKVLQYIDGNIDRPISLDEVAQKFYINKSYLCALFRKTKNTTFSFYVAEKKIARSILFMQSDKSSLDDIARAVGYKDYFYFSRTFKRVTGCSPREYKKRMAGQSL